MESRNVRQLLQSAATGSFLLLSAAPVMGGHIFPEEPQRPHMTSACLPNWGYNQTCWQRFPPVPPCEGASGCNNFVTPTFHDTDQSGQIYAPPSGLLLPDQNIYSQPSSILPPSVGGSRYAIPSQPDSQTSGPELILPSSPMPIPSTLPPLPSPPAGLSQPQEQSGFKPDRLMFAPDGRIVAAPSATSLLQSTSSRYERRSQATPVPVTVPVLVSGQRATASMEASRYAGIPVHFASAPGRTVPAHAMSQGRSPLNSAASNRYGVPRQPGSQSTTSMSTDQGYLAPLRGTPSGP